MSVLTICKILAAVLNWMILALGCFELGLWFLSFWNLKKLKPRFDQLNREIRSVSGAQRTGNFGVRDRVILLREKDWEEYTAFRKDYQKHIGSYDTFTSLIQIFTLLGILGTVAGLYIALHATMETGESLSYAGIGFALSSTVYGIIGAVVFKALDIFTTAPIVGYIDDGIDLFEKDYGVLNDEARRSVPADDGEDAP